MDHRLDIQICSVSTVTFWLGGLIYTEQELCRDLPLDTEGRFLNDAAAAKTRLSQCRPDLNPSKWRNAMVKR
jgi:hypothetical protein